MNGHPRDQANVSVHCRWPLIRGNLTLKCVGRGIDNVAVQGRWPLTTGIAQGRYYCIIQVLVQRKTTFLLDKFTLFAGGEGMLSVRDHILYIIKVSVI